MLFFASCCLWSFWTGTGRTAAVRERQLLKLGVASSATAARDYLVGGGKRTAEGSDLTFLKNAMGNEIAFSVEKGGAARANLLATRTRRRRKLMDAAATRVGASVPLDLQLQERKRRKLEEEAKIESGGTQKTSVGKQSNIPLHFLDNNVGRRALDEEMDRLRQQDMEDDEDDTDSHDDDDDQHFILSDDTEGMPNLFEEEPRKLAFQAQYTKEMARQVKVLNLEADTNVLSSPPKVSLIENDEPNVAWEDGDA